jgi:hypothetical protein
MSGHAVPSAQHLFEVEGFVGAYHRDLPTQVQGRATPKQEGYRYTKIGRVQSDLDEAIGRLTTFYFFTEV